MRRIVGVMLAGIMVGACPVAIQAAPPDGAASWAKTWYDEFNGATIDSSKWSTETYPWGAHDLVGGPDAPNYAESYGQAADSYLENGSLVLRCRTNDFLSPSTTTRKYTHGLVHTCAGYNQSKWWKYGYFEIRAKYPSGSKVWPAFWMLGDGWPPEFDVAEYFGSDDRMHMGLYDMASSWQSTSIYGPGFDSWHTWALEWGPGYAIWYKDGVAQKSLYSSNVPAVPMYLILNSGMRDVAGSTPVPNYFYIDYFRKYDPPSAVVNDSTTGAGMNQCNYSGTWGSVTGDSRLFFNDRHHSTTVNSYVEVQFSGSRVDVFGWKSTSQGIAAFSIDGGPEEMADFYSDDFSSKLVWSVTGLAQGTHTLKMRVTGTKNASSTGTSVSVDRINVWNVTPCLKGTVIGTAGSYNSNGNTRDQVFDGNLDTHFDAPAANGGWAGYDFGSEKKITKVLYCPRSGYADRMVGGKFQGAMMSDFSDAVDLFTVSAIPEEGTMTEQAIGNTSGFRYVRYIGPDGSYCNVAEVEFYGIDLGTVDNFSFELPATGSYVYNPAGASWTFSGSSPNGSGVTINNSGFTSGNANAPNGSQVAFLQGISTISQALPIFIPGVSYEIVFAASQRQNKSGGQAGQSFDVKIDGVTKGSFEPPQGDASYNDYSITFAASAGSHTLSFVGTNMHGGDNTAFIDYVRVNRIVDTGPVDVGIAVSNSALHVTWPIGHTGWRLEANENSLTNAGAWYTVSDSSLTNTMDFPVPAAGNAYYRLVYP